MTEEIDTEEIKENIKAQDTWVRFVFIVIYAVVLWATSFVLTLVVVLQFLVVLVTRQTQPNLLDFSDNLGEFVRQIICYMTFNQDEKPFPFGPWPGSPEEE
ncbi:MAG: DUF4389 domain-containing protein [Pseudomonadales bacterium]|nr:DUF4389 domain-containing protein [Pseudomonadales bacterium]